MDDIYVDPYYKIMDTTDGSFLGRLLNLLSLAKEECGEGSWVGLYIYDEYRNLLLLGPFQGKEACLQIKPGKGVVGECFNKRVPIYVKDVSTLTNYISCDAATKSEYVYPIMNKRGNVSAVFDVDSPELDGLKDKLPFLEKLGNILKIYHEEIFDLVDKI